MTQIISPPQVSRKYDERTWKTMIAVEESEYGWRAYGILAEPPRYLLLTMGGRGVALHGYQNRLSFLTEAGQATYTKVTDYASRTCSQLAKTTIVNSP